MDKQTVMYPYNRILVSNKNKQTSAMLNKMDKYYIHNKFKKAERKRYTPKQFHLYYILYKYRDRKQISVFHRLKWVRL